MGKQIKFTVLSRAMAEALTDKNIENKTALISIYGGDEQKPNIKLTCPTLYMQFDDIEQSELSNTMPLFIVFNRKMAQQIFDFINLVKPNTIIIHCHAGICRSAAVAAALSKIMTQKDDYFFQAYIPNMLVYKTMLEVWFCDHVHHSEDEYIERVAISNWPKRD